MQNIPPSEPRDWLIFQGDNQFIGFATWTGQELELHLPAQQNEAIKAQTDRYLSLIPPSRASEFVNDYFERALALVSDGQLRGKLHPTVVLPPETPSWGQASIVRSFHLRIGIWCIFAGYILLHWEGLV